MTNKYMNKMLFFTHHQEKQIKTILNKLTPVRLIDIYNKEQKHLVLLWIWANNIHTLSVGMLTDSVSSENNMHIFN